jgi:S1-C subfamily serine protease
MEAKKVLGGDVVCFYWGAEAAAEARAEWERQKSGGADPAPAGPHWFYARGKERVGPVSLPEMRRLAASGEVVPATMVLREGTPRWAPASSVAGLFPEEVEEVEVVEEVVEVPAGPRAGRFGAAVRSAAGAVGGTASATFREARRRAALGRLRKEITGLKRDLEDRMLHEAGSRLLDEEVVLPGCGEMAERFRELDRAFHRANQAAMAGDKGRKKEAQALARELKALCVEYGRAAMDSDAPHPFRAELARRGREMAAALADKEEQVRDLQEQWATAPPRERRRARTGFALALLLLLAGLAVPCYLLLRPSAGGPAGPGVTADEKPAAPGRPTLRELFARLSPSVPLVEVVEGGATRIGSGFLVEHGGRLLVITNRHVVEGAGSGVVVNFIKSAGRGEDKLSVPGHKTSVVAVHRVADLAALDVSGVADDVRHWGSAPVTLAPPSYVPQVGEHVFAIGHPGTGAGVLTRTLGDGIVSATGREERGARFLQVTVPLNPGNSGGPLFDDEGRVVGVNTFIIRKDASRDLALEALNFALEVSFVHELLNDPAKSLKREEIAAVLKPRGQVDSESLKADLEALVRDFASRSFRLYGGNTRTAVRGVVLPGGAGKGLSLPLMPGREYGVGVVSRGAPDLDLAVISQTGAIVAADTESDAHPKVAFRVQMPGTYTIQVVNPTPVEALALVVLFEK